jgi:hypothetical protein
MEVEGMAAKTDKPLTAKDLLARAAARKVENLPSKEALAELTKLLELRDSGHNIRRVDAMELLNSHGWPCADSKFDRFMKQQFGRLWGGK